MRAAGKAAHIGARRVAATKTWQRLEQCQASPELPEAVAYEWLDQRTVSERIASGELVNSHLLTAWSLFCSHVATGR